jgi:hypothetical protein
MLPQKRGGVRAASIASCRPSAVLVSVLPVKTKSA